MSPPLPRAAGALTADLLRDLKAQYGMVGTRDVDVAAWNAKLDRAIAALESPPLDFDAWYAARLRPVNRAECLEAFRAGAHSVRADAFTCILSGRCMLKEQGR